MGDTDMLCCGRLVKFYTDVFLRWSGISVLDAFSEGLPIDDCVTVTL